MQAAFDGQIKPNLAPEPSPISVLSEGDGLLVGESRVAVRFVRNRRARKYILRLLRDGSARVTIPRGGNLAEAQRFVAAHTAWLEKQLARHAARPLPDRAWRAGTEILFRGDLVRLDATSDGADWVVNFASEKLRVKEGGGELRPYIERHLWRLAARELPPRVLELAAANRLDVRRITVRNQRSRWGSCSRRGTISLNWRLIQAAEFVRDYIILHELAHLKHMNHSRRFWAEVERLCPNFKRAEAWLKAHGELLS